MLTRIIISKISSCVSGRYVCVCDRVSVVYIIVEN